MPLTIHLLEGMKYVDAFHGRLCFTPVTLSTSLLQAIILANNRQHHLLVRHRPDYRLTHDQNIARSIWLATAKGHDEHLLLVSMA